MIRKRDYKTKLLIKGYVLNVGRVALNRMILVVLKLQRWEIPKME